MRYPPKELRWPPYRYYEIVVKSSDMDLALHINVAIGDEDRTLFYGPAQRYGPNPEEPEKEFQIPLDERACDGIWHSVIVDLMGDVKRAGWFEFWSVRWLALHGEMVLYRVRGSNDLSTLEESAISPVCSTQRQPPGPSESPPISPPVSAAIHKLATLIRARREAGDQPYTLLLGSSLSLTPEVRQAVCGSDNWEAFWMAIQSLSANERRALLAGPLDGLNLTAGYRCLAQLVQAGYFDLVFTLNVDDTLDESLRILPAREYQIFTHGQVPSTEIAAALSRTHPRVKVVKLRGDINAYKLPLTPEGQFEFPEALEKAVEQLLSQDTILVGDISSDTDIQRCIRKGEGALWVVVSEEPRPGSFLHNAKRARRKGEVITGPEAEFVSFFSALARELGVESSEVSDARPSAPMAFEFTFDLSDFKFSSWFPVLESLIPVLPDEIRAKEALYAEGYLDYPPDRSHVRNNKTKWLDKFLQAIVDGEATSGYIALHNLSKDGKLYDHLKVTVDTQSRELKVEITDSTRPERRQALASRILEKMGKLKGVRQVMPSPQSESISPASRRQRISRAVTAPNPFGDMGRITDPDRFFGREELLRQIFEELGKGVNLSLVGESQVGKSSLLSMVCALGPERMDLSPETFAYVSLEWVDDEDDFYEALCDALHIIEPCRGFKLTRALRDKRYMLCLDEIEKMTWDGFTVRVRSQLRGLADGPAAPLKLIIASRSPLAHLFPDSLELDSPLAGICHQLDVGPFSPDVARAFLAHRLCDTGVTFTEGEISVLLAETGGHPARLQRAAADLYRQHLARNR